MNCPVHIQQCDCRELKIITLRQAAIDAAVDLDRIKNDSAIDPASRERSEKIIARVFAACEALDEVEKS